MAFASNLSVKGKQYNVQLFEESFVIWEKGSDLLNGGAVAQRMNCDDGIWWSRIAVIDKIEFPDLFDNLRQKTPLSKAQKIELIFYDRSLLPILEGYIST